MNLIEMFQHLSPEHQDAILALLEKYLLQQEQQPVCPVEDD